MVFMQNSLSMKFCYIKFLWPVFCFIIISCNKVSNMRLDDSSIETVVMDVNDMSIENRDDVFKDIKYVVLETSKDNLIGQIDDLFFIDDKIIVVDKNIAKSVFIFDNTGKFLTRVSNNGRGSHEYLQLTHVFVENGDIAINDIYKREINYFDTNGKFIKTIQYDLLFNEAESLGDNQIVCNIYQGKSKNYSYLDDYSFVVLDGNDRYKPVSAFGADNSNYDMILSRIKNLYSFEGHVYCTINFENVIYELTKDSVIAKYRLAMTPDDLEDVTFNTTEESMEYTSKHPFFHGFYVELKDYSLFGVSVPNQGCQQFVYNHKTKKAYLIPLYYSNPLCSFFSTNLFRYGDNTIVAPINSSYVVNLRNTMEAQGINNIFENESLDKISEEQNPILFFYEL